MAQQNNLEVCGGFFGPNSNPALTLLDISDARQAEKIIAEAGPDVIIHAAAVAHGPESENEKLLQKVNVQGTKNVATAAQKAGAGLVFLSSISALHNMPYGKSKLEGEQFVKQAGVKCLIIRPSVIVGLSPNQQSDLTYNKILEAVRTGGSVREDADWKFQPTWITHVCEIIQAWLEGKFQDTEPIYPIVPEMKTRFEISNDILRHFGLKAAAVHNPRYESSPVLTTDSLSKNNLPVYNYSQILERLVEEIKGLV